ncbi:MbtH family protein [Streptomyces adonidis]|uniref:MbtH family protein n=1 Tax=Streptomyces adonidis TaxID=3231367 RepID=UPI0034DB4F78
MTNPFEQGEGLFLVLLNEEGQYSLWPAFVDIPAGWVIALGETDRKTCLEYVKSNWTDMRPKSLVTAMEAADAAH